MTPAEPGGGEARELIVHSTATYIVGRGLTRWVWRLLFRPRLEDRQLLPTEGGALLCANHQSFLDIPLVAHLTSRHVCFVARDSLARSRILSFIMRGSGAVLVRRDKADRAALRDMVGHLERGDLVAVFPEGTRTRDGSIGPLRAGALVAARQASVPVYPIGIRGAFEAWPRERRLPRPHPVAVRVGTPLDPSAPDALERLRAALDQLVGDGRFPPRAPEPERPA